MPFDESQPGPYKRDFAEVPQSSQEPARAPIRLDVPVTKLLLGANVLVFALMVLYSGGAAVVEPSREMLLAWGADYGPLTLTGEYWRILSNVFVHIGAMHIAFNMYALWIMGQPAERLYGSSKFLFVYLAAGIAGSLTSLYFHPGTLSAGASGAVFGAFGALLAYFRWHASRYQPEFIRSATRSIVFLLLFNLVWGLSRPGIDNAAHVGGFVAGILASLACMPPEPGIHRWTANNFVWALLVVALLCGGAYMDINAFDIGSIKAE